jgi:citrate synthase
MVAAAEILEFEGGESRLVHRILQNLHPRVKAHLLFATKPESVKDLYAFATTVAEGMAIEEQRKSLTTAVRQGGL